MPEKPLHAAKSTFYELTFKTLHGNMKIHLQPSIEPPQPANTHQSIEVFKGAYIGRKGSINIKFDRLHVCPYQDVAASLAKTYENVYLNMARTHIIGPVAATNMPEEWLEAVPKNKITGFGGDYPFCCAESACEHQVIARRNIAQALTAKLDAGRIDLPQAKRIATNLLYDNPKNLFSP